VAVVATGRPQQTQEPCGAGRRAAGNGFVELEAGPIIDADADPSRRDAAAPSCRGSSCATAGSATRSATWAAEPSADAAHRGGWPTSRQPRGGQPPRTGQQRWPFSLRPFPLLVEFCRLSSGLPSCRRSRRTASRSRRRRTSSGCAHEHRPWGALRPTRCAADESSSRIVSDMSPQARPSVRLSAARRVCRGESSGERAAARRARRAPRRARGRARWCRTER
jgi:hypothetical protein